MRQFSIRSALLRDRRRRIRPRGLVPDCRCAVVEVLRRSSGLPKTADGKPNLLGGRKIRSPRTPDGRPDFSRHLAHRQHQLRPLSGSRGADLRLGTSDGQGGHQFRREPSGRTALPTVAGTAREEADRRPTPRTIRTFAAFPTRSCAPTACRTWSNSCRCQACCVMLNEMNAGYRQVFDRWSAVPRGS